MGGWFLFWGDSLRSCGADQLSFSGRVAGVLRVGRRWGGSAMVGIW